MPRENREVEEERRAGSAYELIRMRLDRLEKNIHKPAPIPVKKDDIRAPKPPPDFVRNVVGSSAAAGSAEFHIFRNNRRKEYDRLDYIAKMADKEEKNDAFRKKREELEKAEEERTAKKRAKRQRQKEAAMKRKKGGKKEESSSDSESDEDEPEEKKQKEGKEGEENGDDEEGEEADEGKEGDN